ncbi:MAG: hypothetical protein WBE69_05090 [Candidatus Binataceae bacterium]|jgi:hypothetical protein
MKRVLNNEGLCAQRLSDNDAAYGLICSSLSVDPVRGLIGADQAGPTRLYRVKALDALPSGIRNRQTLRISALAVGCKAPYSGDSFVGDKHHMEIRFNAVIPTANFRYFLKQRRAPRAILLWL